MKHWSKNNILTARFVALFSAVSYAICIPFSKILTQYIESVTLGGLLYLGAGIGLFLFQKFTKSYKNSLTIKETPFMSTIILLDISAITFLIIGITKTTGANISLLVNFELVGTSVFAYFIFKEAVSKKLFTAIIFITIACIILSFEETDSFIFNLGSIFVLLSCICWGLENNFTKKISNKNTLQIAKIKGLGSGLGSLILAFILKESLPAVKYILFALLVGFISYGLSVCLYIFAQRYLGAVKTGAYYSIAPFAGAIFSLILLKEIPQIQFYIASIFMIFGAVLVIKDAKNS